jgi:hypothetical protein
LRYGHGPAQQSAALAWHGEIQEKLVVYRRLEQRDNTNSKEIAMARRAATIEFLQRLVNWSGGNVTFCKLTGIKQPNLSDYLSGKKPISWKRIQKCTSHVFGQPPAIQPIIEGFDINAKGLPTVTDLPHERGLYGLFDSAMRLLYYGKATDLYAEVRQTLGRKVAEVRPWTGKKDLTFHTITKFVSAYRIIRGDADFIHDLEAFGLRLVVNNTFNKNGGSFKRKS